MNEPLISIIVGVYNPPQLLFRKFLDSCINQTYKNVEYILILDDPDDVDSRNTLKQYENFKFKIIENEKNLGVNETHLQGLGYAKGQYIAFFDDDDFFDKDYLEIISKYIIKNNFPIIVKGLAITHYLGNIDYYVDYVLENSSTNEDDWLYFVNRNTINGYLKCRNFVTEETKQGKIDLNYFIDKAIKIPVNESSFYHYIRHDKQVSVFHLNEISAENKDFYNCQKQAKRILLKKLLDDFGVTQIKKLTEQEIIDNIKQKTTLDKTPNIYIDEHVMSTFENIDKTFIKTLMKYIHQIQTKQLKNVNIDLTRFSKEQVINIIDFIKFSGVLNKFVINIESKNFLRDCYSEDLVVTCNKN